MNMTHRCSLLWEILCYFIAFFCYVFIISVALHMQISALYLCHSLYKHLPLFVFLFTRAGKIFFVCKLHPKFINDSSNTKKNVSQMAFSLNHSQVLSFFYTYSHKCLDYFFFHFVFSSSLCVISFSQSFHDLLALFRFTFVFILDANST